MSKKKTPPKEARLSPKQELFCKEYLVDLNASAAAIRAGYSQKTAGQIGEQNLKKLEIQKRVDELKAARSQKVQVNSEDVLRELVKLANADIRTIYKEDGTMRPMKEWPDAIAACVSSIETYEDKDENGKTLGTVQKVKFWDKTKSLDMLGRHLKLFNGDDAGKGPSVIVIDRTGAALDGIR